VLHRKLRHLPTPAAVVLSGGNIDPERFDAAVAEAEALAGS
jgi:hypothetical protein